MRNTAERIAGSIDRVIAAIGRAATWCCLYIVLAEFAVVVMRYALGIGSIRLQESVLYAHAALFMLAAAWTLQVGGHVRVDVFYAQASPRRRAVIDLVGAVIFLFPFAIAVAVLSLPYVERSWAILEGSRETSGLPLVYLLKTLIPLFALLIGLQGIAQAIRAALVLAGPRAADERISRRRDGGGGLCAAAGRLSRGADARRRVARLRHSGRGVARDEPRAAWRAAGAHFRRHEQRRAARHPAVHLHGRDAGALAHRRGFIGNHGPAVRRAAGRPRFLGDRRRRAARRRQGRRRRHHGDHGADRAADHAAPRLRQGACGGHGGGDRDLGADFSAGDRAGAARRSAQQLLSGRAIGPGQFRAADGVGRRPVRRRHHSRPRPGAAVSASI